MRSRAQPRPRCAASKPNSLLQGQLLPLPGLLLTGGDGTRAVRRPQGLGFLLASAFLVTSTPLPAQPWTPDSPLIVAHWDQPGLALPSTSHVFLLTFYLLPSATWFFFPITEFLFFPTLGILLLFFYFSLLKNVFMG